MKCDGPFKTIRMSARAKAFSVDAILGRTTTRSSNIADSDEKVATPDAVIHRGFSCVLDAASEEEEVRFRNAPFNYRNIFEQTDSHRRDDGKNLSLDLRPVENKVKVDLCSKELWSQFHEIGNEMIITKAGRRMFPAMKIKVFSLEPDAYYIMWVDVVRVDNNRYRYVYPSSQWMVAGTGDPPLHHTTYVHPDSPATGRHWSAQLISFDRLKLTNNKQPTGKGQVSLHSMHKYHPRVHVQKTTDLQRDAELQIDPEKSLCFTFPETAFITVTAYQNQQVTKLKIARNPFAKGFREAAKQREEKDSLENVIASGSSFKYSVPANSILMGEKGFPFSHGEEIALAHGLLVHPRAGGLSTPYSYPVLPHPYVSPLSSPYVPFYCVESCQMKSIIDGTTFMHHHMSMPRYQNTAINPVTRPLTTEMTKVPDRTSAISLFSVPTSLQSREIVNMKTTSQCEAVGDDEHYSSVNR